MLTDIQTLPKVALAPRPLEMPSMSELLGNSKLLQTRNSQSGCTPALLGKRLSLARGGVR